MSAAWEQIGIDHVLSLSRTRANLTNEQTASAGDGEPVGRLSNDAKDYIAELEAALLTLGIKIHHNGAVTAADEETP